MSSGAPPVEFPPAPAGQTVPHADHSVHRGERARRLRLAIASSLLTKPLALLMPLVTVPLFLRYLGVEGYGLYESVAALVVWLGVMNFGTGMGLVNKLTACDVAGDRDTARRYVSSYFIATAVMLVLAGVVVTAVVPLVNWSAIFKVSDPHSRAVLPWAVWLCCIAALLDLGVATAPAIYTGYQEVYRSNVWEAAVKITVLIAACGIVFTRTGLLGVIFASAALPPLVRMGNLVNLFWREKPWLRPKPALMDWRLLWGLLSEGVLLLLLQMSTAAILQSDKLVIGIVIRPEAVTSFAVLTKLFVLAFGLFMLLLGPLWPAYGEAIRRGDRAWVNKTLRWSILYGCGMMIMFSTIMLLLGDPILRVWTHGRVPHVSRGLIVAVGINFTLWCWITAQSVPLNGAAVIGPQLAVLGTQGILNVALAVVLARRFGVDGVAWSMAIAALASGVWGYPRLIRKHLLKAS